ncbi:UNVERIFIED_CONTAM: hypothetical protein FKN15_060762 [Acipenser sinensis]
MQYSARGSAVATEWTEGEALAGGSTQSPNSSFKTRERKIIKFHLHTVMETVPRLFQRAVYKDLVLLLQRDSFLTVSQLRAKGELNFEQDFLVEGGKIGGLTNGTEYKEVRQFRSAHHLVRFYFLTRVYSKYLESVLADFQAGPQPDVLIVNSCVWDVSRYGPSSMEEYRVNLGKFFTRLGEVLLPECLVMWNMAMPLGKKIYGGFLIPELQHLDQSLRSDIIEANFYSATLADSHRFDVLDLHYHFRFELQNRTKDGVHWNQLAHRKITSLLLAHIAEAWSVEVPDSKRQSKDVIAALNPVLSFLPCQIMYRMCVCKGGRC